MLVHTRSGDPMPDRPSLILLHGRYGDHTQLKPLAEIASKDQQVFSLRAPRTQTRGHEVIGYYWYVGDTPCQPEASTFGDALLQVERFMLDRDEDDTEAGFVLGGRDEGAVLALVLAGVWPELVRGVVAIDPCLVEIPKKWELPQDPLDGVSILLTSASNKDERSPESLGAVHRELDARGARVQRASVATPERVRDWLDASFET